ncbi:tetratricopeptide repeat protein [Burkholderia ubonensis]|uniref:tetratricopeptide repeat protein n=2 Tax=Burkholderia ubonensis TaxID=101571 RepID=UPI000B246272|nr:hypothetical protein [Burkholderia ubonensis]
MTEKPARPTIPPSPNRGDPPDFWRMEWKQFEELTCAVLDKEPDVKYADLFHLDGQPQYGVDSYGDMNHEFAIVVASSKCYESIIESQIENWSSDFLKHYDSYWKARNVRRFILAVASPVHGRKTSDMVATQKKRFHELGIEYEVWGPRQFQEKLRFHRGIVTQFLGTYWANQICGDVPVGSDAVATGQDAILDHITNQVTPLISALSEVLDSKLESLKQQLREEPSRNIVRELEGMRSGSHWPRVVPNVKSKCLRYLASAKLQQGDIDAATALADEADALSTDGAATFRALLLAHQGDQVGALRLLEQAREPEAQELKAALLIQTGRLDEAAQVLDRLPAVAGEPSIEASRLRAFLLLYRGERTEALAEIRRAETRAPRWFAVRRSGAVIRYANALSKVVGEEHFAIPTPVAAELVREDDSSQELLKEALATFESLSAERESSTAVSYDEIWALACQCNLVDGLPLAQAHCDRLLEADPACPEVVSWVLARGLKLDHKRSLEALRTAVEGSDRDAAHVLAYSWLLTLDAQDEEAREVLVSNHELFQSAAQCAAYEARLRFLKSSSTDPKSSGAQDAASSEQQLVAMVSNVSDELSWERLEALFVDLESQTPNSMALLAAATRLAAAGRWKFLSGYISSLIGFETASAIEIAVHAAYNTGNAALALEILKTNRIAFPKGKFPRNLRAIEAPALVERGEHRSALKAAETLSTDFDGPRERMLLADIRLALGDIRGALPIIRAEVSKNALPPSDALRLARLVAIEDRELARKLLRHADIKGLPAEFAFEAHLQAHRLGLEREAAVLESTVATLIATPGNGAFTVMTLDELKQHQASRNQNRLNLWQSYLNGAVPFHVVSQFAEINLGEHYYIAASAAANISHRPPLLIRHGARALEFDTRVALKDWRLYIDVSSFLLAKQLGILETIEASVATVIVPRSIQGQLLAFADSLEHPQPTRLRVELEIGDALQTGTIKVWQQQQSNRAASLPSDTSSDTWTVATVESDEDLGNRHRITIVNVVEGMRQSGQVDEAKYADAIAEFGAPADNQLIPPPGARVLFRANTLAVLAFKCTLQAILKTYVVLVDEEFATFLAQSAQTARERHNVLRVVNELRQHIADQLAAGNYETVRGHEGQFEDDESTFGRRTIEIQGLLEFLRTQPSSNAVFFCDDRYVTGYPGFGAAPVVGIFEVLRALKDAGKLSDEEYFAKLIHLRSTNAMFLPIETQEVMFHLERAAIVNGHIVETHPLSVIRRYVARVALLEPHLKIGNFPALANDRPDEAHVLLANRRLTDDCITKLWTSKELTDEQCSARSTWIWSQLRMERHLGVHPSIKHDQDSVTTLVAVTFSAVLGVTFQLATRHSETRKRAYSQWLLDSAIKSKFRIDHQLADNLVAQLGALVDSLFAPDSERPEKPYSDETVAAYLRKAFDILPDEIRERLLCDKTLQQRLKTQIVTVVNLEQIQLLRDKFIVAVRKAMQFGKSQAKAHESSKRVAFQAVRPPGTLLVKCDGQSAQIFDQTFTLFEVKDASDIRSFLGDHVEWFDCHRMEREQAIDAIANIKSAERRYDALDKMRRTSLALHYKEMEEQLQENHSLPLVRCTPPRPMDVLRHLRLSSGTTPFAERWAAAADCLIADYGLGEAFIRLGCLPVPLPPVFVDRFMASTDDARTSLYSHFVSLGARSPVHFFHALSLLKREELNPEIRDQGLHLATDVLSRWNDLSEAIGALLTWVENQAHEMQEWREHSIEEQLVTSWYHATRLMCILNRHLGMEAQIGKHFAKVHGAISPDSVLGGLTRALDCASPNSFVGVVLLFGGLNYALYATQGAAIQSAEQLETVLGLTRVSGHFNPWLYSSREAAANRLDSFLRVDKPALPESIAIPPGLAEHFEDELLRAFETTPDSGMPWIHLYSLARMGLRAANRQRFVDVVSMVQLSRFSELDDAALIAWRAIAGCVNLLGDSSTRGTFQTQLIQLAKTLNDRFELNETPINLDAKDERARRLSELVEACILFCRGDDVAQAYGNVGELLSDVATVWSTARSAVCRTLEIIYDESRLADNSAIWNSLMHVRAQT